VDRPGLRARRHTAQKVEAGEGRPAAKPPATKPAAKPPAARADGCEGCKACQLRGCKAARCEAGRKAGSREGHREACRESIREDCRCEIDGEEACGEETRCQARWPFSLTTLTGEDNATTHTPCRSDQCIPRALPLESATLDRWWPRAAPLRHRVRTADRRRCRRHAALCAVAGIDSRGTTSRLSPDDRDPRLEARGTLSRPLARPRPHGQ